MKERVANGGHNIPEDVIERRYGRGLTNFFNIFFELSDYWAFVDNSKLEPVRISEGNKIQVKSIYNSDIWNTLRLKYE